MNCRDAAVVLIKTNSNWTQDIADNFGIIISLNSLDVVWIHLTQVCIMNVSHNRKADPPYWQGFSQRQCLKVALWERFTLIHLTKKHYFDLSACTMAGYLLLRHAWVIRSGEWLQCKLPCQGVHCPLNEYCTFVQIRTSARLQYDMEHPSFRGSPFI